MERNSSDVERRSEDIKRVARILQIVQLIAEAPRRYLRKDIAARFEVSDSTIKRDIDVIRHGLKLPIQHTADGYYLERIPNLPPVQYSFTEALALLTSVQAARQISGIASPELAAAISRLESQFPAEFTPYLDRLRIQPPVTARGEYRQKMLMLLNHALVEGRKILMTYETRSRGGALTERKVRPYHLMPYVRSWQLIAYCELRQTELMFKLDRIKEATLTDEPFTIPEQFDLESYLGWSWGILRGADRPPDDIVLHFEADTGHRVIEEDWHPSQQATILPDGRVQFTLRAIVTPEFISWLLYYGAQVEVVQPLWLREKVALAHQAAALRYVES